ncbi:hypothetical protein GCM10009530_38650 [Microbispora corallina]|uniref:histidine kinase n=1 Tax=Microbispora corallina TaxID=83302 RepID=A0ABQ4G2V1_9ACTN|nr:HAMP domain-containing sensor histidine kinase [Microbispora corallina]GIH41313.1 hypothetical protein Mco01_43130 [Microbispora corallina]
MPAVPRLAHLRIGSLSLRSRITLLVTMLAVVLLAPTGLGAATIARQRLSDMEWRQARAQAAITAQDVLRGRLTHPVVPRVAGIDLVQVVTSDHHVLDSSAAARTLPPLTAVLPSPQRPRLDVQSCGDPRVGCVRLSVVLAGTSGASPVVYAGGRVPGLVSTGIFDTFFAVQVAGLVSLTAWTTWRVTGRVLRPVEAIRAELASINLGDLDRRVPVPSSRDEIAQLADTVNGTLSRLDQARRCLERMAERQRQFASDASHELRTPIAGLRAQLEEAQLHPEDSDLPALLERALGDVDRLESIAADLLLLARLGSEGAHRRIRLDLAELVRGELTRRLPRCLLHARLEPGTEVEAEAFHLRRACGNLLDNALRHARRNVWVEVRRVGDGALLTVTDDGDGIPEPDRERVFHRFTRLDTARSRNHGGTGLGLAIALEVAHAHGGTLSIEDCAEGGARFVLRLPLAPPGTGAPEEPAPGDL